MNKPNKPVQNLSAEERSKMIRKSFEKAVKQNGKALERLSKS